MAPEDKTVANKVISGYEYEGNRGLLETRDSDDLDPDDVYPLNNRLSDSESLTGGKRTKKQNHHRKRKTKSRRHRKIKTKSRRHK